MSALSPDRRAALDAVIAACPDAVLGRLETAVSAINGPGAEELAAMVAHESLDRSRRVVAFGPLVPMFRARTDGVDALTFPAPVLIRLWREVSKGEEALMTALDEAAGLTGPWALAADRLCAKAANVLRDRAHDVWPDYVPPAPDAPPATPEELAGCFDLCATVRKALPSLGIWLHRPDDAQLASLRLTIQDGLSISDDGGRRMVDILFSHAPEAERMLRIVTQSNRMAGNEMILSHSDMGVFVERLLAAVRRRTSSISAARATDPGDRLRATVADAVWCASVLNELDGTLQIRPDSPWGKDTREARIKVAGQMSSLMQSGSAAVHAALPMKRRQLAGRMTRLAPWLEAPLDVEDNDKAAALLSVLPGLHSAAEVFGCGAERSRLQAELTDYLTLWANEALDAIGAGEAELDADHALRLVGVAARFLTEIDALAAARAVRRRASSAEFSRLQQGSRGAD